jgi:hypothetical protein
MPLAQSLVEESSEAKNMQSRTDGTGLLAKAECRPLFPIIRDKYRSETDE